MEEYQDDKDSGTISGRKLMKLDDLEEDDQGKEEKRETDTNKSEIDGEKKSQERVCPICSKSFSSGKALGGHMSSAHVQAKGQKGKSHSKKLMKRKYNNNHAKSVDGYDDFIDEFDEDGDSFSERSIGKMEFKKKKFGFCCRYCGKYFPSKKSLFGHMRCHPDRPYRGMDPPDCNNPDDHDINNSSMPFHCKSEFEELQVEESGGNQENQEKQENPENVMIGTPVVDLAQFVGKSWFTKGLRGCGATANSSFEKSDFMGNNRIYEDEADSVEECHNASYLLMHLHNSGGTKSNFDENVVAEAEVETDEDEEEEAISSATPVASPSEGMELFLDFAMSKKTGAKIEQASNEEEDEEADAVGLVSQLKNKGRSKAILENGKDDNSSDDTKSDDEFARKLDYARKGKGKIVEQKKKKIKCNKGGKLIIRIKDKLPSSSLGEAENVKEFRCTSCGKTFATHQALGGHKSSHNKFKISIHNTIDDEVLPLVMDNQNEGIPKMLCNNSPSSKGGRICKKRKKAAAAAEVQKVLDFDLNELPEGEP